MSDINVCCLEGRVAQNPTQGDLRYTSNGSCIFRFNIANGKSKKVGDNWEEETSFFGVKVFGNLAERLKDKICKGMSVTVVGRLTQDTWQDRNTNERKSFVYIVADSVKVHIGANRQAEQQYQAPMNAPQQNAQPQGYQGGQSFKQPYPQNVEQIADAVQGEIFDGNGQEFPDDIPF